MDTKVKKQCRDCIYYIGVVTKPPHEGQCELSQKRVFITDSCKLFQICNGF